MKEPTRLPEWLRWLRLQEMASLLRPSVPLAKGCFTWEFCAVQRQRIVGPSAPTRNDELRGKR